MYARGFIGVTALGIALLLCPALISIAAAQSRELQREFREWQRLQIGKGLFRPIGDAVRSASDLAAQAREWSRDIATARRNFWAAYPSGSNRAQAEAAFGQQLAEKDLYHLILVVAEGAESERAAALSRLAPIDGGIPHTAREAFEAWVAAVRRALGASPERGLLSVGSAETLLRAIERSRPAYDVYREARDWAEFDAASREPEWIDGPRTYVLTLLRRYRQLDRARAEVMYRSMVEAFDGEEPLLQSAQRIRTAPKANGLVADVRSLGFGLMRAGAANAQLPGGVIPVATGNPWDLMAPSLALTGPRGYLIALILDAQRTADTWRDAVAEYRRWVLAFGERAVLDAASEIARAPKRLDSGRLARPESLSLATTSPYWAVQDLLARKDARGHVRAILAHRSALDLEPEIRKAYDTLAASYGEERVLAAARDVLEIWARPSTSRPKEFERLTRQSMAKSDHDLLMTLLNRGGPAFALDADLVQNPVYLAWARFSPGSSATHVFRSWEQRGKVTRTTWQPNSTTVTLTSVSPERVETQEVGGLPRADGGTLARQEPRAGSVPARVRPDSLATGSRSENSLLIDVLAPDIQDAGVETVVVAGKELTCRKYTATRGNATLAIWVSDEVPGGVVHRVSVTNYGSYTARSEYELTAFTSLGGVRSAR